MTTTFNHRALPFTRSLCKNVVKLHRYFPLNQKQFIKDAIYSSRFLMSSGIPVAKMSPRAPAKIAAPSPLQQLIKKIRRLHSTPF